MGKKYRLVKENGTFYVEWTWFGLLWTFVPGTMRGYHHEGQRALSDCQEGKVIVCG